jgi:hypothetical protein
LRKLMLTQAASLTLWVAFGADTLKSVVHFAGQAMAESAASLLAPPAQHGLAETAVLIAREIISLLLG